jgi:hypothetical protein
MIARWGPNAHVEPPAPPCTTKIVATTLRYIGPEISSAMVEVDPDKGDTVTFNFAPLNSDSIIAIDARDSNENELGAKTKIRINGVEEVIHTSCSTDYVAGLPAPLDNPKGDPSPNWFVEDFVQK